ncbi:MAG: amino acid carrier protein [Proteobacteria bacterium]|jgi:alanine or glycine:cation symporter, AGCS family|nr:amino acid carrier protein [Pseudomonadota bacterium]
MDFFWTEVDQIGRMIWGPATFIGLLGAGILFTLWTRITQYRVMTHGIDVVRGVYDDPDDPGAINHFQALSAALSATVGLGNIAGVALAIGAGGPGALVWMWIVGFFGMALKNVEITLAMMYRDTSDPENPSGGAMHVVRQVLGDKGPFLATVGKIAGVLFCVTLIISTITGGNMFQAWSVAGLSEAYFGVPKLATGIILAVVVGMVILGGIRRIGTVAGKLVPFMCLLYLLSGLAVLAINSAEIPRVFSLIFSSAFGETEASGAFVGGTLGYAFMIGMKRALFSNEAGQGSAPIAHAAAKTGEPAREGIVGGLGPFIDTICICTLTALVILTTNTWNRPAIGDLKAPISMVQSLGEDSDTLVYSVESAAQVSDLPEQRLDDWSQGDKLFLRAQVDGAIHKDRNNSIVLVKGVVVTTPVDPERPDAATELQVEWDKVTLSPDSWRGMAGGLTLEKSKTDGFGVYRDYEGAQLTAFAFDRVFPGLGKWLVTIAAWLFAISTMISWSYYGEKGVTYLFGTGGVIPYKLIFLVLIVIGAFGIESSDEMLLLADLGTGSMLVINIPIILCLGGLAVKCLRDYDRKFLNGEFPRQDMK